MAASEIVDSTHLLVVARGRGRGDLGSTLHGPTH